MSDAENFVARWSRLKRETAKEKTETDAARSGQHLGDAEAVAGEKVVGVEAPPAPESLAKPSFDPASLPPIDSITAASDIRAFLQSGVPAELTKAALRRVWTTDPAIRDFIGIAENQWDFTDPTTMPGFGPLEATDDVAELVAQAMGKLNEPLAPSVEDAPDLVPQPGPPDVVASQSNVAQTAPNTAPSTQVSGMPEGNKIEDDAVTSVEHQRKLVSIAPQHADPRTETALPLSRRPHGGALPQ